MKFKLIMIILVLILSPNHTTAENEEISNFNAQVSTRSNDQT